MDPVERSSYTDRLILNSAIVGFGALGSCATQLIIAPLAVAAALGLAAGASLNSPSEGLILILGLNLVMQLIVIGIVAAVAIVIRRLWLLQGWIIGALIGFLLYCACYGMIVSG